MKRAWKIGIPMAFGTDIYFDVPGHTRGTAALTCLEPYLKAGIPSGGHSASAVAVRFCAYVCDSQNARVQKFAVHP